VRCRLGHCLKGIVDSERANRRDAVWRLTEADTTHAWNFFSVYRAFLTSCGTVIKTNSEHFQKCLKVVTMLYCNVIRKNAALKLNIAGGVWLPNASHFRAESTCYFSTFVGTLWLPFRSIIQLLCLFDIASIKNHPVYYCDTLSELERLGCVDRKPAILYLFR
jgi:hypothetical protein